MNKIKGIKITENASLKNLNTYKLDSSSKYLINVSDIDGLKELIKYLKINNIAYYLLGNGSNVILDDYFDGAVILLNGLKDIIIDNLEVTAYAGVKMGKLATKTVDNDLTGLEWAINIPGTIGGSVVNNAGAYNSCIFDSLKKITVLTDNLEIKEFTKDDLRYDYRETNIKDLKLIVLSATFILEKGNKEESLELIKNRCERRKATQPLDLPTAGSVFRNPSDNYAGKLIEEAGLKGKSIGGAKISPKHANFIVNTGNATSKDIKSLIKLIEREVKDKFNIDLVNEQEIIDWNYGNSKESKKETKC
ncbi:MAG: UDP-N-acetylmuramate dehydrogenase [Ruminococcus sp.]|nr:UDP-N-acetylmuramate dehydrogenase [Ruminococcus sp.]